MKDQLSTGLIWDDCFICSLAYKFPRSIGLNDIKYNYSFTRFDGVSAGLKRSLRPYCISSAQVEKSPTGGATII